MSKYILISKIPYLKDVILYCNVNNYIDELSDYYGNYSNVLPREERVILFDNIRNICNILRMNLCDDTNPFNMGESFYKLFGLFLNNYEVIDNNKHTDIIDFLFDSELTEYMDYKICNKIFRKVFNVIKNNTNILIKLILESGRNFIRDDFIYIFLRNNNIEIVKYILNTTQDYSNSNSKYIREGIIIACKLGHIELLQLLLTEIKIEIEKDNMIEAYKRIVLLGLEKACISNRYKAAKILLELPPKLQLEERYIEYIFVEACRFNCLEIVKLLLDFSAERGLNISRDGKAFVAVCQTGNLEICKELIKFAMEGYPINLTEDNFAFKVACNYGNLKLVKFLISLPGKFRVNPEIRNNDIFINSCMFSPINVIKFLIDISKKYNIDVSAQNNSAFIGACRCGRIDVVKLLINLHHKYGVKPSAQDNEAIIDACINERYDVVKFLLELPAIYNINPSAQDNLIIKHFSRFKIVGVRRSITNLICKHPRYVPINFE